MTGPADKWNMYDHAELAEMASAQDKVLPAETTTTDLTIKMDGKQVYPEVQGESHEDLDTRVS